MEVSDEDIEDIDELHIEQTQAEVENLLDPGRDVPTITAQTYTNYKSALKWWHEHHDGSINKIGYPRSKLSLAKVISTYVWTI